MLGRRPQCAPFARAIAELLAAERYDVALVWYGAEFVAAEIAGFPPAIADRIDCGALQAWRDGWRESGPRQKLRTLRRAWETLHYERSSLRPFAAVLVTGPDDARALRRVSGHPRVVTLSNGVTIPEGFRTDEGPVPTVIFTGVLAYAPNIQAVRFFVTRVWPGVLRRVPGARFVIAGRSPTDEVRALADRPGVELHGDVPDINDELRRAWVAVAPMRSGSGIKNKALEAWAAERPVVLTPLATNGLELDADARTLVARSAAEMEGQLARLLVEPERRRALGTSARRLVRERHSWTVVAQPLHRLLAEVAGLPG
jgi:glycosyltransferase involved in cell wall biosynthesis